MFCEFGCYFDCCSLLLICFVGVVWLFGVRVVVYDLFGFICSVLVLCCALGCCLFCCVDCGLLN